MQQLKRGRHRKLKKRFIAFDHERNRAVWSFGAIVFLPSVLFLVALKFSPLPIPDPFFIVLFFGIMIGSLVAGVTWARKRCLSIARDLGLICSRCSQPLADVDLRRYPIRQPFTVPSVCPHCKLAIDEAARSTRSTEK